MSPSYQSAGFFMLRAPAHPFSKFTSLTLAPGGEIPEYLLTPDTDAALYIASSTFSDELTRSSQGNSASKPVGAQVASLRRYLKRMSSRATPFGTFSAVGIGSFGESTEISLAHPAIETIRIRADLSWLMAFLRVVEEEVLTFEEQTVQSNSLIYFAGDRILLPSADIYGGADNRTINIRASHPTRAVLEKAKDASSLRSLQDFLNRSFPEAGPERCAKLVRNLWENHFLVGTLRPRITDFRPDKTLARELRSAIGARESATALQQIAEEMDKVSRLRGAELKAGMQNIAAMQKQHTPEFSGQTIQVDSSLAILDGSVSTKLGEKAADCVDVLMRLAQVAGPRDTSLTEYRNYFLDNYGVGALVSVNELLSPLAGIEAPSDYSNPGRTWPLGGNAPAGRSEPQSLYDRALVEELQRTAMAGDKTVEISDAFLDRVSPSQDTGARPMYPFVDAYIEVAAGSREEIDKGNFTAVLRPESLAFGGRTFSRFADLYESTTVLGDWAKEHERLRPDAVFAELSYFPPYGKGANVTTRPLLHDYEIPVNVAASVPSSKVIALDDLYLGSTPDRLYIWSAKLNREVVVVQNHMLSLVAAPNICRFLIEASMDGYVQPMGFSWGSLEGLPFLPRVARNGAVLRPAQWILKRSVMRSLMARNGQDSLAAVREWREMNAVPRYVNLAESDNRLLLDFDDPHSSNELSAASLKSSTPILLQEAFVQKDQLWLTNSEGDAHVCELVVPVRTTDRTVSGLLRSPGLQGPVLQRTRDHVFLPGGEWTQINLYAPFDQLDDVVNNDIRPYVESLTNDSLIDRWFYMRYADPAPHLRVRFRSPNSGEILLEKVACWGQNLVKAQVLRDFRISAYKPEFVRYGGAEVFDLVERFFEANSAATVGMLNFMLEVSDTRLDQRAIAVFAADGLLKQFGFGPAERLERIPGRRGVEEYRVSYKARRNYLTQLLAPWDERPHADAVAHSDRLQTILRGQLPAVSALNDKLREAEKSGLLLSPRLEIVLSLLHMQVNRLMISGGEGESEVYGLWKLALQNLRGRPDISKDQNVRE